MELLQTKTGLILWMVFLILIIALFVIALVNLVKSTFKDSTDKLFWLLVILFVPVVGPILYLVAGRKQKVNVA